MTLTADNVADYADTLVLQARGSGCELDYSETSIVHLERYFRISDDLLRSDNLPEHQRQLVVFYGGCYLGEVMARELNGVWSFETDWRASKLVFTRRDSGIQIQPFQKVYLRVTEAPEDHSLAAYYGRLRDLLEVG